MRRHLLNLLTVLSLLLCVVVVVLWVRSYTRAEHFWLKRGDGDVALLRSDQGILAVQHKTDPAMTGGGWRFEYAAGPLAGSYPIAFSNVRRIGPVYFAATAPPVPARRWIAWAIVFPAWLAAGLLLLLPLGRFVWLWRLRSQYRTGYVCPACGYDLRATPSRCPECGAAAGGDGTLAA